MGDLKARQPAGKIAAGFILGIVAFCLLLLEDEDAWAIATAACAALGAGAALLHAHATLRRGGRLTRGGVVGRFALAGCVLGLIGPMVIGPLLALMEDGAGGSFTLMALFGAMLAPAVALYGLALATLAGLIAARVLFVRRE